MRRRLFQALAAGVLVAGTLVSEPPRAAALPLPELPSFSPPVLYQQTWPEPDWPGIADETSRQVQSAWDAIDAERAETALRTAETALAARRDRLDELSAGSWHRLDETLLGLILDAADTWGIDARLLARIVVCESGGDPTARNASSASGLTQQLSRYWPARAASAGFSGASVFDPWANLNVAAQMLTRGTSDWFESRSCWR